LSEQREHMAVCVQIHKRRMDTRKRKVGAIEKRKRQREMIL
jgi:hypothetical protein